MLFIKKVDYFYKTCLYKIRYTVPFDTKNPHYNNKMSTSDTKYPDKEYETTFRDHSRRVN
jgi:hypothetical protein